MATNQADAVLGASTFAQSNRQAQQQGFEASRELGFGGQTSTQRQASQAAITENRNLERRIRRFGGGEALESLDAQQSTLDDIFDLLGTFNHVGAGFVVEMQKSGNAEEAFKAASSEFLAAMPFISKRDAFDITGAVPHGYTYADALRNTQVFEDGTMGPWGAAATGFVLDVLLDPLTFVGIGAASKIGKALGGTGELKGAFTKALDDNGFLGVAKLGLESTERGRKAVRAVGDTRGASFLGSKFIPDFELKRFNSRMRSEIADLEKKGGGNADLIARKQAHLDLGKAIIQARPLTNKRVGDEINEFKREVLRLSEGLLPEQRVLMGTFLDQPKKFNAIIDEMYDEFDEANSFLKNRFDMFRTEFKRLEKREAESLGLFSPNMWEKLGNDLYAPIFTDVDSKSLDRLETTLQSTGRETRPFDAFRANPEVGRQNVKSAASKFTTLEEVVDASVPIETDIALMLDSVASTHIRKSTTEKLWTSVLGDPDISIALPLSRERSMANLKNRLGNNWEEEALKQFTKKEVDEFKELATDYSRKGWEFYSPPFDKLKGAERELSFINEGEVFNVGRKKFRRVVDDSDVVKVGDEGSVRVQDLDTGKVEIKKGDDIVEVAEDPQVFVVPTEISNGLKIADGVFRGNKFSTKFGKILGQYHNLWKGYALLSPGFHARNMPSNVFNAALGGLWDIKKYGKAMKIQRNWAGSEAIVAGKGANELKGGEAITKAMEDRGLLEGGAIFGDASDVTAQVKDMSKELARVAKHDPKDNAGLRKLNGVSENELGAAITEGIEDGSVNPFAATAKFMGGVLDADNRVLRQNRKFGTAIENNARMALFIDRVDKGDSLDDAAMAVKKYLFDYNELTDFERNSMRNLIPFYTWMRKNIPLQLASILKQPGKYHAMSGKLINGFEEVTNDWENIPVPDYFQEVTTLRLPRGISRAFQDVEEILGGNRDRLGTPIAAPKPVFLKLDFPFADLNILQGDGTALGTIQPTLQNIAASLAPLPKLALEQIGGGSKGFSLFQNQPLELFEGQLGETDLLPFVGGDERVSRRAENIISTLAPGGKRILDILSELDRTLIKDKPSKFTQKITSFIGAPVRPLDVRRVRTANAFTRRDKLRALDRRLKQARDISQGLQ